MFDRILLWSHWYWAFVFWGEIFHHSFISVLVIGLFIIYISSWFSLGRLYLSKSLSISSKLPNLLASSRLLRSFVGVSVVTSFSFLILLIWALSFFSWWVWLKVSQFCLHFQRTGFQFHWSFLLFSCLYFIYFSFDLYVSFLQLPLGFVCCYFFIILVNKSLSEAFFLICKKEVLD